MKEIKELQVDRRLTVKALLLLLLALLSFSCDNAPINDPILTMMEKHEVDINGKKAFFSLPLDYQNSVPPKRDNFEEYDRLFFYESQSNSNNYFVIIEKDEDVVLPDALECYVEYVKEVNKAYINSVTCTEKKTLNDHPLYYMMHFYRYPLSHGEYNINGGDSICSSIEYITYYENIRYHFVLYSEEHVDDFSYEEKRKVLESIRF